ncbi:MAG: DUF11 domain-containing protein, partial [Thermoflexales bacterium]|nr:DUF11 domain-containing protein [Thermoflexales bacterium]
DFTNIATATGTPPVGPDVTDTDPADVDVINPGLDVHKTVSLSRVAPTQVVTYMLTATNTGDVPLDPVVFTDTMDAGLTYIPGTASPAPSVSGQVLTWLDANAGVPLAPGAVLRLTFQARVTTTTGTYRNVVVAAGITPSGPVTDTDEIPVTVTDPSVDVAKGVNAPGAVNGIITFTIHVTNTGPSILDVVPLIDHFVGPVEYVGGTPPANRVDNANGVLAWDDLTAPTSNGFGRNLDPGEAFIIETVFSITASTDTFSMTNTAAVTGATDIFINPTNNPTDTVPIIDIPTAVELLYFRLDGVSGRQVSLAWATAVEIDNFGFKLYRAGVNDLARAQLIHFESASPMGGQSGVSYAYIDTVPYVGMWWYWLADVDTTGRETLHAPLSIAVRGVRTAAYRVYLPVVIK